MLLDGASLWFRAFHGIPATLRAADGRPVNAVRGLLDFLARFITDYAPTQVACCWDDAWRPAWRVALLPSYKAHRVAYRDEGAGEVLLLIHGIGGSSNHWRSIIPALSGKYRVIAPDLLGHGQTANAEGGENRRDRDVEGVQDEKRAEEHDRDAREVHEDAR